MDVRGALRIDPDTRVGLQAMQLTVRVAARAGSAPELTAALVRAAEQYCITLDTLRNGLPVEVTFETPTPLAAA
jgi:hypothetical protein